MSKKLPSRPHLRHLRNQAKQLHKAYQSDNPDAIQRIAEHHPQSFSKDEFTLQDAQLVIAREYGFPNWPNFVSKIKANLADQPASSPMLNSYELLIGYDHGDKIILNGLRLDGEKITGLKIKNANLHNTNLCNADLTDADLTGVNFENANFKNANLNKADLPGCSFVNADFEGVDFSGIKITGANMDHLSVRSGKLSTENT